ncbi:hypothetical protein AMEX_G4248 [Astyanax mexicanus]|uniref:Ig-like domain-containing protein n=1 Tax=Astyanax mexicanus TaxID=7994 RepID=A0A8T2ME10_ASTMX|nr:hypothetical protein AMEX_G4248 [Astyanax mexicanus]
MEGSGFLWVLLLCGRVLLVSSEFQCVSVKEKERATLPCGKLTKGKVTWSREINGQRESILTTHNGEITQKVSDPDRCYSSGANIVLIIQKVSQSDAGRYNCNESTVELIVNGICTVSSITSATTKASTTQTTIFTTRSNTSTTATPTTQSKKSSTRSNTSTTSTKQSTKSLITSTMSTTATTSTQPRTTLTSTVPENSTQAGLRMALITAGGCVVAVLLIVLLWRCFFKRKVNPIDQTEEHFYDTIADTTASPQPKMHRSKTNEPIYSLATLPRDQIREESLPDPVYAQIK